MGEAGVGMQMINTENVKHGIEYANELLYRIKWGKDYLNACEIYRSCCPEETAKKIHLAKDFFSVAFEALNYAMMMEVIKLCEEDRQVKSVPRFFNFFQSNSEIKKFVGLVKKDTEYKMLLRVFEEYWNAYETKQIVSDIKTRRDNYYAHSDKKYFGNIDDLVNNTSVCYDDINVFLNKSHEFVSGVYLLLTGVEWQPKLHQNALVREKDCSDLFKLLDKVVLDEEG